MSVAGLKADIALVLVRVAVDAIFSGQLVARAVGLSLAGNGT